MAVTIVSIEHQYLEQLQAAVDSVSRERRFLGTVEGFSLEQHRQFAESITQGGGVQLVALNGDAVVGWCDIRRNPFEGFRHVGALGVGLLPEWREQGLGRRLINATIDAARTKGVTRVELETFASNPRAIHVFELLGFKTEGTKRRARVLDDQEDDLVCMALLVS
jgi:RimJ/RimL family protein N-acetyltransferase